MPKTVWRRSETVLWRSLGGMSVLRSADSGEFVTLNALANLVWLALEYPASDEELGVDISAVVGADNGADVVQALAQLGALGLVIAG